MRTFDDFGSADFAFLRLIAFALAADIADPTFGTRFVLPSLAAFPAIFNFGTL